MNFSLSKWKYPLSFLLILFLPHTYVKAQARFDTTERFYEMPFGSIGFSLSHIRDASLQGKSPHGKIQILEPSKVNILPTQDRYCFVVNHRLDEALNATANKQSYFAVKVVFNDTEKHVPSIHLFRNSGWSNRSSGYPIISGLAVPARVGLVEFNNLHSPTRGSQASFALMDRRLGLQWHGQPIGSSKSTLQTLSFFKSDSRFETFIAGKRSPIPYSSEDFLGVTRIKRNPLKAVINANRPYFKQTLTGFLIAYAAAPQETGSDELAKSKNKVVFCFRRHKAVSAYMSIHSPLQVDSSRSWYSLVFDKDSRLIE